MNNKQSWHVVTRNILCINLWLLTNVKEETVNMVPCKALPKKLFRASLSFQAQYLMLAACTGDQRTRSFYIKDDLLRRKIKAPALYSYLGGGSANWCLKLPTAVFGKALPKQQLCICSRGQYTGKCQRTKPTMAWNALLNPIYYPSEIRAKLQEAHNPLELHGKCCMPRNISFSLFVCFFCCCCFWGERVFGFQFTTINIWLNNCKWME